MHFNPRSREGSDGFDIIFCHVSNHFNPRSREGSDCRNDIREGKVSISIHAPARGATPLSAVSARPSEFQSTLPRGERPPRLWDLYDSSGISIHAPARGATDGDATPSPLLIISIHAPARGATRSMTKSRSSVRFQSTLPRGERQAGRDPERGGSRDFNPRSREGSDRPGYGSRGSPPNFNPRSREGSDHKPTPYSPAFPISIHAPARGATPGGPAPCSWPEDFNPRSREGSDLNSINFLLFCCRFQSTLPRGERQVSPRRCIP